MKYNCVYANCCGNVVAATSDVVVLTARCYASSVLAMVLCLSVSVCLSVCVNHKSEFY